MAGVPTVAVVHYSSGGHVRPLLPLVAALGDRGARTVQWALPFETRNSLLRRNGIRKVRISLIFT